MTKIRILKNVYETYQKKNLECFFLEELERFFFFLNALQKFLDIPKIPIYLSLNIDLFLCKKIYLFFFKISIYFIF